MLVNTVATVPTVVLVETGQTECKPRQVSKSVTRLAWLAGMGTKMSRKAASSGPFLRVVTSTETVEIFDGLTPFA
jgi:hypothetical protein